MFGSLSTVVFALTSALVWGAADFFGGFATKKNTALKVVFVSQIVGGTLLFVFALVFRESFVGGLPLVYGAIAGISGALALLLFYNGLSTGKMSVFAPLTAVITSIIPIIISAFTEGRPTNLQLIGFILALVAVWLLSSGGGDSGEDSPENTTSKMNGASASKGLLSNSFVLAVLAGMGFSGFLIFIDLASADAIFWPLVAARLASVTLFFFIIRFTTGKVSFSVIGLGIVALSGVLDASANALYALASSTGRLDIAVVLGSLFPISTIFLAWVVLKERLGAIQWVGVVFALIAIVCIAL